MHVVSPNKISQTVANPPYFFPGRGGNGVLNFSPPWGLVLRKVPNFCKVPKGIFFFKIKTENDLEIRVLHNLASQERKWIVLIVKHRILLEREGALWPLIAMMVLS